MSLSLMPALSFTVGQLVTPPMDPGQALRKIRVRHGYSQLFLANCLGISRIAYLSWESNKVNLSLKSLEKVCGIYEIRLSEFISGYLEN